jgi:3-methylfumaryl-CoA hydratase
VSQTLNPFAEWIGRKSQSVDFVSERLVESFRAIFDPHLAAVSDGCAPLGIHWCLSPVIAPMSALGDDGHPSKNLNLPPIPQPRRMWAGGWIETRDDLRIGDRVKRVSTIAGITRKQGKSGELWFVAMDHEYVTERGPAIRERHDIVYREAAKPKAGNIVVQAQEADAPIPTRQKWILSTSSTLLFRYSALSFNGHRIHYDLPYATEVEGYAGLVVHGPIQATLLFNLAAASEGHTPARFQYRGVAPAIAGQELLACAGVGSAAGTFWTQSPDNTVHMRASSA